MPDAVLDASAVLAVLKNEPGAAMVEDLLLRFTCAISSVNISEVAAKLADRGATLPEIDAAIESMRLEIHDLGREAAIAAGALRPATRSLGMSLGDRVCVELAQRLGIQVVTTDRKWARLALDVPVVIARPQ